MSGCWCGCGGSKDYRQGAIAEELNISVSTVEKHLAKGLRLLTEGLASPQGDLEPERIETWPYPKGRKTSI